jgi:hypothetical protein
MTENPFKKINPPAMEGRLIDKTGKDIGDKAFHETFMDMTPETEEQRLKELEAFVAEIKRPPGGRL